MAQPGTGDVDSGYAESLDTVNDTAIPPRVGTTGNGRFVPQGAWTRPLSSTAAVRAAGSVAAAAGARLSSKGAFSTPSAAPSTDDAPKVPPNSAPSPSPPLLATQFIRPGPAAVNGQFVAADLPRGASMGEGPSPVSGVGFGESAHNLDESYQRALDRITDEKLHDEMEAFQELVRISRSFEQSVLQYGRTIIAEQHLPKELKTIKPANLPGIAGGEKYLVDSIMFRFPRAKRAAGTGTALYSDDDAAAKEAGHQLRSLVRAARASHEVSGAPRSRRICLPLMMLVDWLGCRLVAVSQVPIDGARSLVYGSADGGRTIVDRSMKAARATGELCERLGLAPHLAAAVGQPKHYQRQPLCPLTSEIGPASSRRRAFWRPAEDQDGQGDHAGRAGEIDSALCALPGSIRALRLRRSFPVDASQPQVAASATVAGESGGTGQCSVMFGPVDLEVHRSAQTGRLYALDLARLYPPEPPARRGTSDLLTKLLRPELVLWFSRQPRGWPLSSDAFLQFQWHGALEHQDHVKEACAARDNIILPLLATFLDSGCQRPLTPVQLHEHGNTVKDQRAASGFVAPQRLDRHLGSALPGTPIAEVENAPDAAMLEALLSADSIAASTAAGSQAATAADLRASAIPQAKATSATALNASDDDEDEDDSSDGGSDAQMNELFSGPRSVQASHALTAEGTTASGAGEWGTTGRTIADGSGNGTPAAVGTGRDRSVTQTLVPLRASRSHDGFERTRPLGIAGAVQATVQHPTLGRRAATAADEPASTRLPRTPLVPGAGGARGAQTEPHITSTPLSTASMARQFSGDTVATIERLSSTGTELRDLSEAFPEAGFFCRGRGSAFRMVCGCECLLRRGRVVVKTAMKPRPAGWHVVTDTSSASAMLELVPEAARRSHPKAFVPLEAMELDTVPKPAPLAVAVGSMTGGSTSDATAAETDPKSQLDELAYAGSVPASIAAAALRSSAGRALRRDRRGNAPAGAAGDVGGGAQFASMRYPSYAHVAEHEKQAPTLPLPLPLDLRSELGLAAGVASGPGTHAAASAPSFAPAGGAEPNILDSASMCRLVHSQGVNLRCLGALLGRVCCPAVRTQLQVEMLARAFRKRLHARWRRVPQMVTGRLGILGSHEGWREEALAALNELLGTSPESVSSWLLLLRSVQSKFPGVDKAMWAQTAVWMASRQSLGALFATLGPSAALPPVAVPEMDADLAGSPPCAHTSAALPAVSTAATASARADDDEGYQDAIDLSPPAVSQRLQVARHTHTRSVASGRTAQLDAAATVPPASHRRPQVSDGLQRFGDAEGDALAELLEGVRLVRESVPPESLALRIAELCGIKFAEDCVDSMVTAPTSFFAGSRPFGDADVEDLVARVKSTPDRHNAEGSVRFVRALHATQELQLAKGPASAPHSRARDVQPADIGRRRSSHTRLAAPAALSAGSRVSAGGGRGSTAAALASAPVRASTRLTGPPSADSSISGSGESESGRGVDDAFPAGVQLRQWPPALQRLALSAAASFEQGLSVGGDDAVTLCNYGYLLETVLGLPALAAQVYLHATEVSPAHARSHYYLALCLGRGSRSLRARGMAGTKRDQLLRALEGLSLRRALQCDPAMNNARKDLANFLRYGADREMNDVGVSRLLASELLLRQVLQRDSTHVMAWINLSDCYMTIHRQLHSRRGGTGRRRQGSPGGQRGQGDLAGRIKTGKGSWREPHERQFTAVPVASSKGLQRRGRGGIHATLDGDEAHSDSSDRDTMMPLRQLFSHPTSEEDGLRHATAPQRAFFCTCKAVEVSFKQRQFAHAVHSFIQFVSTQGAVAGLSRDMGLAEKWRVLKLFAKRVLDIHRTGSRSESLSSQLLLKPAGGTSTGLCDGDASSLGAKNDGKRSLTATSNRGPWNKWRAATGSAMGLCDEMIKACDAALDRRLATQASTAAVSDATGPAPLDDIISVADAARVLCPARSMPVRVRAVAIVLRHGSEEARKWMARLLRRNGISDALQHFESLHTDLEAAYRSRQLTRFVAARTDCAAPQSVWSNARPVCKILPDGTTSWNDTFPGHQAIPDWLEKVAAVLVRIAGGEEPHDDAVSRTPAIRLACSPAFAANLLGIYADVAAWDLGSDPKADLSWKPARLQRQLASCGAGPAGEWLGKCMQRVLFYSIAAYSLMPKTHVNRVRFALLCCGINASPVLRVEPDAAEASW